ncbi:hypothetical protein C8J56DRAFT_741387, partial [Mycena floridula]
QPLTLSDIIPTAAHVRSTSMSVEEDDSVIKSILAKAIEIPSMDSVRLRLDSVRPRLDSDSSSKRRARDISNSNDSNESYDSNAATNNSAVTRHSRDFSVTRHSRHSSGLSFAGFDSFEEVRRGFECHENRAPFYPP